MPKTFERPDLVDFENYIQTMAETCFQVYEEMAGHSALGLKIEKIEPPFAGLSVKKAIVIPYENKNRNLAGRFILGFDDVIAAVKLAGRIAGHAGMPAIEDMDDLATDVLFEFMNTVAGKVITEWDGMGMNVDFYPPEFSGGLNFDNEGAGALLMHAIILHLQNKEKLTLLASLQETEEKPMQDKKVLVVDDSRMIRTILTKEFERQGCQVSEAENGLDGFIKCHAFQPDLIIMDLIMPKMGGLEAIAKIREVNSAVPIIILTSTSKKEEVLAAAALKIKGYIKKPISLPQLLKLAQSCFL